MIKVFDIISDDYYYIDIIKQKYMIHFLNIIHNSFVETVDVLNLKLKLILTLNYLTNLITFFF